MPFYEYECEACGHHLEALQKISDAPLRKCPDCGRSRLRRLISPPVFRLKGSGWYETDFKSDKEARRNLAGHAEKEEAKPASAETKTETKADAKAESKPETKPQAKGEARPEASAKRTSVAVSKPAAKRSSRSAHRKRPKRR
jgi:putative FmdB family regulatory protein